MPVCGCWITRSACPDIFIWLLTGWIGQAYESRIWPILGFIFMPYTTLAYLAAMLNNDYALSGLWLVIFIIAIIADVGNWGGGRAAYRKKR